MQVTDRLREKLTVRNSPEKALGEVQDKKISHFDDFLSVVNGRTGHSENFSGDRQKIVAGLALVYSAIQELREVLDKK